LWRGLSRHIDGCHFPIQKIGENSYRLAIKQRTSNTKVKDDSFSEMVEQVEQTESPNLTEKISEFIEMGKRSVRAIKSHFPKGTALLESDTKGHLRVVKTNLTKKELGYPVYKDESEDNSKPKKYYMILDNKTWKLKDSLYQELNAIEKQLE
jgi:hypothetical protein